MEPPSLTPTTAAAQMSQAARLQLMFETVSDSTGMMGLVAATDDDSLDQLEAATEVKIEAAGSEEAADLQQRLGDLRRWRATGQQAQAALAQWDDAAIAALTGQLMAWIETPDWDASADYLRAHAAELLTDAGAAALTLLRMHNPDDASIEMHVNLLAVCRQIGIEAGYAQLRQEFAQQEQIARFEQSPLWQAVIAFVQAADDDAAAQLQSQPLLSTTDARDALQMLLDRAIQTGATQAALRIAARLALWQAAWGAAVGGPLRRADEDRRPEPAQPWRESVERQSLGMERAAQIRIVTANNCTIGDNNTLLNIYNVGELPLAWGRPNETRPDLAAAAVGRARDLDDLHRRLQNDAGGLIAIVGMRGMAGVGKTVLAAMYATRYADQFPGGVIWVSVGPQVRQADHVTPLLQRLAAYAYNRDVRVAWLDQIVFAPDAVQMLLGRHGRLLLIFDDVWSVEAATALKAAAPPGSAVLLTTRDHRVAYALGGPDAVQELDVLTADDARGLLQKRAPGLPDDLANRVAEKLGRHAQALALAGSALYLRKPHRYAVTAADILERVARGVGFGDLPDLDQADQETNVEIALKYTYDYLGEDRQYGAQRQACLRALGSFAQETSFDAAAAASLWQTSTAVAEEMLLLFDHLALIREESDRWQQHAILRAYALSLQTAAEKLALPERHADHYLKLAQASIPSATDRVALEFIQIEHAFAWCQQHSPSRATRLANIVSQVMFIRGRAGQAGEWLRASLDAANQTGDRGGRANTLKSLGDLERRLGNVDAARRHYDAALPLYEAEQARLGRANTLKSLGDLESRLGNVDAARRHYDAALDLYRAEQEPGGIINTLVSQARLEVGTGNLDLVRSLYEQAFRVADQTGYADHPIVQGMRREYAALGAASTEGAIAQNLVGLALSALLQVDSDQALAQALHDHPILHEAPGLFALAGLLNQALQAQERAEITRLLVFLVALLQSYNDTHQEEFDLEAHSAVIDLCAQVIPLAGQLDAGLATALRQEAAWACNTLGNHAADTLKDLAQAVAAYSRGLTFDPANAMLLRNRAGVHLNRRDLAAAQADIAAAAALQPDAPRLADLRQALAAAQGEA